MPKCRERRERLLALSQLEGEVVECIEQHEDLKGGYDQASAEAKRGE